MEEPQAEFPRCWCGAQPGAEFAPSYRLCTACATLVCDAVSPPRYGLQYWAEYLPQQHGQPDHRQRARDDLGERCLVWLRALLRFETPPARVLEVGCGAGAFTGLLAEAGFDAAGLELGPELCAWVAETFAVPVYHGTLESQHFAAASWDAIALFDVLEHLADPLGTLRECVRLLRPGGCLLVQTPCLPAGQDFPTLESAGHRFLEQLKPGEHRFLLSESAARLLASRAGAPHVTPLAAAYPHYDQFFAASAAPLAEVDAGAARQALEQTRGGRIVYALLAVAAERDGWMERFRESA
jgi:SAM-dependent methyltransferase